MQQRTFGRVCSTYGELGGPTHMMHPSAAWAGGRVEGRLAYCQMYLKGNSGIFGRPAKSYNMLSLPHLPIHTKREPGFSSPC